jgi:[acyl-carrier-protein] S-malonyltransferase
MQEAGVALRSFLDSVSVHAPQIPIYSNLTGELYPSETDEIKNLICNQLSHSVRWETIIRKMNVQGIDTYLEVGAGKTLSGFVAKTITDAKIANVENCQGLDLAVSSIL